MTPRVCCSSLKEGLFPTSLEQLVAQLGQAIGDGGLVTSKSAIFSTAWQKERHTHTHKQRVIFTQCGNEPHSVDSQMM